MFIEKSIGEWRDAIEEDPEIRKLLDNGVGTILTPILDQHFPRGDTAIIQRQETNGKILTDSLRRRIFAMAPMIYSPANDKGDAGEMRWYLQCYFLSKVAEVLGDE